jgi:hypothetical protein
VSDERRISRLFPKLPTPLICPTDAERRDSVVQVRSVILIALLAVVRKLIILDLSSTDATGWWVTRGSNHRSKRRMRKRSKVPGRAIPNLRMEGRLS